MNLLTTCYTYPLAEKCLLSKQLNAYLDNPRTDEEINRVKLYIQEAYSSSTVFRYPEYDEEEIKTLEKYIFRFFDTFAKQDRYIHKFSESYRREDIFEFMARMWVIARFDDAGQAEFLDRIQKHVQELRNGEYRFVLLEDSHPIITNAQQLVDYSYMLSLFIHTQEYSYRGNSFIIDPYPQQFQYIRPNKHLPLYFIYFGLAAQKYGNNLDENRWYFLPYVKTELEETTHILNTISDGETGEKLMYVGRLLRLAGHDVKDVHLRLVILVNIIEFLLTHNPAYQETGSKTLVDEQVCVKASILIYARDKTEKITTIEHKLRTIYGIKSSIVHGDFSMMKAYLNSLSLTKGEQKHFEDLIADLYRYIRIILSQSLVDPDFIQFLKQN